MEQLEVVNGKVMDSESITLEFKSCKNGLSKDFWPTYSAFANTFGGRVIMGIDDAHMLIGVDDPDKIIKDLWDLLNDGKKVNINLIAPKDVKTIRIDEKTLICVDIPRAERRKRPIYINGTMENGTYKRNGEGDYHCSIDELKQMLRDASDTPLDSEIALDLTIDDLDIQSIKSFRERMSSRNPAHPWNAKSNEEFLRLIGACSKTPNGLYPTMAGLLMFGYDYSIMSKFPNYHLDYLEFANDSKDWTFRLSTGTGEFTGNIYTFLTNVSNRLVLMNNRGKNLEGMSRIDDTYLIRIQRELMINALAHADYAGLRGIRVEWRPTSFSVRNPGNLRMSLHDMIKGGISDPRNPHLALMMGLIGMAERAGSGVSDVVSICRNNGMPDPDYEETTEPETVTVMLKSNQWAESKSVEESIIRLIERDPTITLDRISKETGMERSKVSRIIKSMKEKNYIQRIGGTRGRWNICL